jgi:predicted AAA+ superfamily ATPase
LTVTPYLAQLQEALQRDRVVVLTGPRQCGKTRLARELFSDDSLNYSDLEDRASLARLEEPIIALQALKGLVVIDEAQRRQDLFPILRVLADRKGVRARFLILAARRAICSVKAPIAWRGVWSRSPSVVFH